MSNEPRRLIKRYKGACNDRDREWLIVHIGDPVRFNGEKMSRGQLLAAYEIYWNAFPDCDNPKEKAIAAGDRVVVREGFTGTHEVGNSRGNEPTGESVDSSEMIRYRFENGQIAEVRDECDELGFYEQIGANEHPTGQ